MRRAVKAWAQALARAENRDQSYGIGSGKEGRKMKKNDGGEEGCTTWRGQLQKEEEEIRWRGRQHDKEGDVAERLKSLGSQRKKFSPSRVRERGG